jgi:cation transport regulator ChaC
LVQDTAAGVEGTLFAFPAEQRTRVESYLRGREGPTHPLVLTAVHFEDSSMVHEISAMVAINDSNTEYFVDFSTREERIKILRCSGGSAGTGLDYLRSKPCA